MRKPLWVPSEERIKQANITRFISLFNEKHGLEINSYGELYKWSIENIQDFWAAMWEFGEIKAFIKYDAVVDDLSKFPGANWFVGARLNFAENLLRYRDDNAAFIFRGETGKSVKMTYAELFDSVARLAKPLRDTGLVPGDRVAAYMPNLMETAIAMLSTTSVGAIWSSCGTELGPRAVVDRLGQVEPRVLLVDTPIKGRFLMFCLDLKKLPKEYPRWRKSS